MANSLTQISCHEITRIKFSPVKGLDGVRSLVRYITLFSGDDRVLEIVLFSDSAGGLHIQGDPLGGEVTP